MLIPFNTILILAFSLFFSQWLAKNISKKMEKSAVSNGLGAADKALTSLRSDSVMSAKLIYPETSQMVVYDPRQKLDAATDPSMTMPGFRAAPASNGFHEILKATPPALVSFLANLPIVEGPTPNVDIVLSICLQSDIPTAKTGKLANPATSMLAGPAPTSSDLSGSNKSHPNPSVSSFKTRDRQSGKRKDLDRQEDDEATTVQSQPQPRDAFRIRQIQRARAGGTLGARTTSQTGSASFGSALSGDLSGSTG
ncbi:hypothetical protein Tsubulata_002297 [Turnera subulata]|uniref:Uncharacterized protein n=1 Tax=Turnera subulata TaxID=218843 RepID=A0A9Q0FER9_9ROSI|nr:hypothetical protein Tsubulata_002297 [Turnera subulata]